MLSCAKRGIATSGRDSLANHYILCAPIGPDRSQKRKVAGCRAGLCLASQGCKPAVRSPVSEIRKSGFREGRCEWRVKTGGIRSAGTPTCVTRQDVSTLPVVRAGKLATILEPLDRMVCAGGAGTAAHRRRNRRENRHDPHAGRRSTFPITRPHRHLPVTAGRLTGR